MSPDPAGGWTVKALMTEVVGSGPKTAADMTRAQAREAFERILDGRPDPTTLGAFLLANRWKHNTPAELAAFVDVMRERSDLSARPTVDPVDCGANYDGKRKTALLGVGAAAVAAAAGTPVVVHSGDLVPTKRGVTYKHVLDELGVQTDLTPTESAEMADETGVAFYYQPRFNSQVDALLCTRERMGVRTFLNTIETLANPANARVHVGSFFHQSFAERVIETVRESRTLDIERVVLVQGVEGYDEARLGHTAVAEWNGSDVKNVVIDTAELGIDLETADLEVSDVAADSARITEAVLSGEHDDQYADAIALNAAIRIYAGGESDTVAEGVDIARDVIASGNADDVLFELREFETT